MPKLWTWFSEERVTYWVKVLLLITLALYLISGVLAFLARIESIAILLIAAIFFAYLLYPAVRALNLRLPLIGAILVVYGVLAILAVVLLTLVLPALSNEVSTIVQNYPQWVSRLQLEMRYPDRAYVARLPEWLRLYIAGLPNQYVSYFHAHGYDAAMGALTFAAGTLTFVAALVIVPVISAYLLMDSESIKRYFIAIIPPSRRDGSLEVLSELEAVIGGFIRGQLLVGASVGILITLMLTIMHVPYAFLIGLGAAILDIVPYVGAVVSFIPAVLLAFFNNGPANAVIVAALFIAIFEIEGHFIAPNIVSKTVALSPLSVVLAILIGGELMGVVGMFIAVPVAGMLRVLAAHVIPHKASVAEAHPALTEAPREQVEGVGEALR